MIRPSALLTILLLTGTPALAEGTTAPPSPAPTQPALPCGKLIHDAHLTGHVVNDAGVGELFAQALRARNAHDSPPYTQAQLVQGLVDTIAALVCLAPAQPTPVPVFRP